MFPSTTALLNFLTHHTKPEHYCKMLARIECAVRGEEIYTSFQTAPAFVQTILKAVFDFHACSHLSTDGTIQARVMFAYLQAKSTIHEMESDVCRHGLVAFGHFVDQYLHALRRMNSRTYFDLPERSSDETTNRVCDFFEKCQYDPLPDFMCGNVANIRPDTLPSNNVRLPDTLPWYLRKKEQQPDDFMPLLLLQRVAVAAAVSV